MGRAKFEMDPEQYRKQAEQAAVAAREAADKAAHAAVERAHGPAHGALELLARGVRVSHSTRAVLLHGSTF